MKRALLALILLAAISPQDVFARNRGRQGYYRRSYAGRYVAPQTYYRPYYRSYYSPNYYGRNYYGRYYGGYRGGYYPYYYPRSGVTIYPGGIRWYW